MGASHVLPKGTKIDRSVLDALTKAESLAVELDPSNLDSAQLATFVAQHGRLEPGVTLPELLGEEDFTRLAALIRSASLQAESLVGFQPWVITNLLMMFPSDGQLRSDPEQGKMEIADEAKPPSAAEKPTNALGIGLDLFLIQHAREQGKTIHALESLEEQGRAMASLDLETQVAQLRATLNLVERGANPLGKLIEAYLAAEIRVEDLAPSQGASASELEYWKELVDRRNETMTKRLTSLLRQGHEPLVVVGAVHLLGARSIRTLLEQHGYSVRRVAKTGEEVVVRNLDRHTSVRVEGVVVKWPVGPDDWPGQPRAASGNWQVTNDGITFRLTILDVPGTELGMPPQVFYEMNRSVMADKYGAAAVNGEPVAISGIPAERVYFETKELVYEGRQVLADGRVYWAVATANGTPSAPQRTRMREFVDSLHLEVVELSE